LLEEKPELLFLDEPTNHLDIESREVLEDALADYNGAILAVSHDRYFIEKCKSKILGFFGNHVEIVDSYEIYRKKYKTFIAEEDEERARRLSAQRQEDKLRKAELQADKPKKEKPTVNRAQERKENARRMERTRFLEKRIAELEEEQKSLESSFGPDTSPDEYQKYAANSEELENLYSEYMELESN
ncbi:MAG: ABC-F family ATP-binding cassette domain-containing protein, partial [Erysipelotrichaceae bacterium]|nr:ABC-F family ATP-binding cassette domain-containing protein [Erysipelotrichaceae bacterium]